MYGNTEENHSEFREENKTVEESEVNRVRGLMKTYPLLQWSSFLKKSKIVLRVDSASMCSLFTLEPPHNLHLGTRKLARERIVKYLSLNLLVAGGSVQRRKPFFENQIADPS